MSIVIFCSLVFLQGDKLQFAHSQLFRLIGKKTHAVHYITQKPQAPVHKQMQIFKKIHAFF